MSLCKVFVLKTGSGRSLKPRSSLDTNVPQNVGQNGLKVRKLQNNWNKTKKNVILLKFVKKK